MADTNANTTIIGADTHITGEMRFESNARILGTFEGKIAAKGELQVADGATCKAEVDAGAIVVDGTVEGDVTARDKVQLNPKARIQGDVVAAKLIMAEGASFTGHCRVGPDAVSGKGSQAGSSSAARSVVESKPDASKGGQQQGQQPQKAEAARS